MKSIPATAPSLRLQSAMQRLVLCVALAALAFAVPASSNGKVSIQAVQLGLSPGLFADRLALLAIKAAIPPGGYGTSFISSGWPSNPYDANFNPCSSSTTEGNSGVLQTGSWAHIICQQSRVVQIKLQRVDIAVGQLPDELASMNKLDALYLNGNKVRGTIPNSWAGSRKFRSLTQLWLGNNRLSGTLPSWNSKGAFRRLQELQLDSNNLAGPLPTTWAGSRRPLRALTSLTISRNSLSSSLPAEWGTNNQFAAPFPRLKELGLEYNSFTGTLPSTWSQQYAFGALRQLRLGNNGLSGTLPTSWGTQGSFPRLRRLELQWNDLGPTPVGGLPTQWTQATVPRAFPSLQVLVIFNGNDNICGTGSTRLQGDSRYEVQDASGRVFLPSGGDDWRACPP